MPKKSPQYQKYIGEQAKSNLFIEVCHYNKIEKRCLLPG
jgi:hypothetical protein